MKGWWRKAVEAFQKAVEASPNSASMCGALGQTYNTIGEFDKAFPFCKKAIALSPAWAFPCYDLGSTYYGLDDLVRAEEWFKKALELQPDLDVAQTGLIDLYLDLGEYISATMNGSSELWTRQKPRSPRCAGGSNN